MKTKSSIRIIAGLLWALTPPGASSQWLPTNVPSGHLILCFAVQDSVLYAGDYGDVTFTTDSSYPGGVFRSTNGGWNWTRVNNGLSLDGIHFPTVEAIIVSGKYVIAGTSKSGAFRSSDRGDTWIQADSGLPSTSSNVLRFLTAGQYLFAGVYSKGVYRSSDDGASWSFTNAGISDTSIHALAAGDSAIVVATVNGPMFRSTNNGNSWTLCPHYLPYTTVMVASGSNLFAGTWYGGVYQSSDNGTTWNSKNSGIVELNIEQLAVSSNWLFACTTANGYIYASSNMGGTWSDVTDSLRSFGTKSVFAWDTTLFAGGNGIYRRRLSDLTTGIRAITGVATLAPTLMQNYPNPFNPATIIRYYLPRRQNIQLSIVDILGRTVDILVDGPESSGEHEVRFDGHNLSSGIYFYRLMSGGSIETRRLGLIR